MEVDKTQFRMQLLSILKHISNATFISIDLEMSGISIRSGFDDRRDPGRPTLQQIYEETRKVAETFQILQVGITCVEEDRDKEYYLARPYNFNLSPLTIDNRVGLDRKFSFSSSACDFLKENNFDFGKVFSSGVPYLSRDEEDDLRERNDQRDAQNAKKTDIVLSPDDQDALEFYRMARKTISEWTTDPKPKLDYVNVGLPTGPLNGFQRRLVHQLVHNEFPEYRTFPRNEKSFMQVVKLDREREAQRKKEQTNKFNGLIAKQTGLRWIFEALTGGDLSDIESSLLIDHDHSSENGAEATKHGGSKRASVEREFAEVREALEMKEHIIVGHNLFTDLLFIYRTFFGKLPLLVEDFQEQINELFPSIIDTKYLLTHDATSMGPRENLKDSLEPFKKIHTPLIVLDERHISYGVTFGKDHEAGFDSWMTAELFVKLTAKLYAARKHVNSNSESQSDRDFDTASEDGIVSGDEEERGGVALNYPDTDGASMQDNLPPEWHATRLSGNKFSALEDLGEVLPEVAAPKPRQWIPSMGSSFWDVYCNKLRVNASEAGVCILDG